MLENENVKLRSGPLLYKSIKFAPELAKNLKHEYSDLELTIELVDDVESAIKHINNYGSNHTESIVTSNGIFPLKLVFLCSYCFQRFLIY